MEYGVHTAWPCTERAFVCCIPRVYMKDTISKSIAKKTQTHSFHDHKEEVVQMHVVMSCSRKSAVTKRCSGSVHYFVQAVEGN
jgi:hypothetical protein